MKLEQLKFISNPLTIRYLRMLDYMETSGRFTIDDLAKINGVSTRTTVSDIGYLKKYFGKCILLNYGKYGYMFKEIHRDLYSQKKEELLKNEFLLEIISNIFHDELESIVELSHQYHISEGTLRRALNQSRSILMRYDLDWQTYPLNISGNEANIRKFLKDFFYEGYQTPFSIIYDAELQKRGEKRFQNIIGNYDVGSGTTFRDFYYTIYIAIQRFSMGKQIFIPDFLLEKVSKQKDFKVFCTFRDDVKELYDLELPVEEFAWIYLSMICKRTVNNKKMEERFWDQFNWGFEISQMAESFMSNHKLSDNVQSNIKLFIETFLLSRKINDKICPALNKESSDFIIFTKNKYKNLYEDNWKFLSKKDFVTTKYKEDVCASLTIHFVTLIDLYQDRKNILFMMEGEHFIFQLIVNQAEKLLGSKHKLFYNTFNNFDREYLDHSKIDLIVTNGFEDYVSAYHPGVPYIKVNPIPDENDWLRLILLINPYASNLINFGNEKF